MGRSFFKYIFVVVVLVLGIYTGYKLIKDDALNESESPDQTSKVSTIQKDIRLAIAELDTMNPILSKNRNVQEISKIIFDPLVTLDENYKLKYCLATEVVKQDDLNYLIKLHDGVLWQNGSNFTANDVKFTIDTIKSEGVSSIYEQNLRYVNGLNIVDEHTVQVSLTQPVPFFEYNLTFPILSEEFFAGEDFVSSEKNIVPVGTGMFKIESTDSNIIKLVKNDTYWDNTREPMIEEVIVNLYASMGEVYNAFKSGELDILIVKSNNVEDYIGTLGYNKVEYKARDYDFLAFNTQAGFLAESAVRKAISLIIDKDAIVASCLGSGYVSSNFSLDMGNWLYIRDLTVTPNIDEARRILEEAGWIYRNNSWTKDGTRIAFDITVNSSNEARMRVAEAICDSLESFGIRASVSRTF